MKRSPISLGLAALYFLILSQSSLAQSPLGGDTLESPSQSDFTAEEKFITAVDSAKALVHMAAARDDIVRGNIVGAQRQIGDTLTLVGQMKSRFPELRLEELVHGARVRLTYQEPRQVGAYLELITPAVATIPEPTASIEAMAGLDRAKKFLSNSDKEGAEQELETVGNILSYKTAGRTVALVEKNLLAAEAQLDKSHPENAYRWMAAANDRLRLMAAPIETSGSHSRKTLWAKFVDNAGYRWSAAKDDFDQAAASVEHALNTLADDSRSETRNLTTNAHAFLNKAAEEEQIMVDALRGFWHRSESLAERALDYQTAAWEKFQATDPGSKYLIDAKRYVAYAEIEEFTTGDKNASKSDIEKAQVYLSKAAPQMRATAQVELKQIAKELAAAKNEMDHTDREQKARYAAIESSVSGLIH